MKSNIILFILSALLFLGCQKNKCYTINDGFKSMKPNCFEKAIRKDNVTIVDVRKISEFVEGHIDGAISMCCRATSETEPWQFCRRRMSLRFTAEAENARKTPHKFLSPKDTM